MTIPNRYQIFDAPVVLSSKDEQRLRPHLAEWVKLARVMLLGINEADLRRLIVMELRGKQRWHILSRLLMRLGREQRKRLETQVKGLIKS